MKNNSDLFHKDLPVYSFETAQVFWEWLSKNYESKTGFWLRFYKKATNKQTVQYDEAVEVALCFGWIDGLLNSYDDESYLLRFTQRRPKSVWSKVNVARVEKLIIDGRMQPSGLVHINSAKNDGRWAAAYSSNKSS